MESKLQDIEKWIFVFGIVYFADHNHIFLSTVFAFLLILSLFLPKRGQ